MSSTKSKSSQTVALAQVQALIAGTQKHFPNGQFTLGTTAYTTAALTQALQSLVDAFTAVNEVHARTKDAVRTLRNTETTVAPLLRDYKRFLHATFSTATAMLAEFGLQPLKARKPLDSAQRATAAAKAKATRKARGTMGKKQKLAVQGDVTSVEITPVRVATSPSPSAAPAEPGAPPHATGVAAK
jgi:hypothetical protein